MCQRHAQSEQDEQDLNWISGDDFSGANKGKRLTPPPVMCERECVREYVSVCVCVCVCVYIYIYIYR